MTQQQQPNATQKLINFLDKGLVYIYRPVDELDARSWLQTSTENMDMLLNKYNKSLVTHGLDNVTAQIIINGQLRHETAANNINAIIQYFRDNKADFTNYEEKVVRIRYVFGNSVTPDRVTQEELIETAIKYDICYRYAGNQGVKYKDNNKFMTWINDKINILSDQLSKNNNTLKGCRYGITVVINGETRHAWSSEDYESIINYFREWSYSNSNEITQPMIITIKYVTFRM